MSRSGDQTEEVVEEYLKRDLRISRLDHEGQGISSARNQGISLADGGVSAPHGCGIIIFRTLWCFKDT